MENSNEQTRKNKIATLIEVIAWFTYIGGFFAGISFAYVEIPFQFISGTYTEFSSTLLLTYWTAAFVSGSVFLGLAEIIKLLQKLVNQRELIHTFVKERKNIKREELFDDLPEL